jgi:hypothetical protein
MSICGIPLIHRPIPAQESTFRAELAQWAFARTSPENRPKAPRNTGIPRCDRGALASDRTRTASGRSPRSGTGIFLAHGWKRRVIESRDHAAGRSEVVVERPCGLRLCQAHRGAILGRRYHGTATWV